MSLGLVSCGQSEKGKDDHSYNASETGTEKVPEGGVSDGMGMPKGKQLTRLLPNRIR